MAEDDRDADWETIGKKIENQKKMKLKKYIMII